MKEPTVPHPDFDYLQHFPSPVPVHITTHSAWERVQIARHLERFTSLDLLTHLVTDFFELHGDRTQGDDPAIITGIGFVEEVPTVIVTQEKGRNTEERLFRNFGMSHPEGFRKANRAFLLAEQWQWPVLCLIDTPGAYPGLEAELRGQSCAIAKNLLTMIGLKTPTIGVIIGEGCSGGALAIALTDRLSMARNSYFSVISPNSCASILWKDTQYKERAAEALKITAEDIFRLQLIDAILEETTFGNAPSAPLFAEQIKKYFLQHYSTLKLLSHEQLLLERRARFRHFGSFLSNVQ